MNPEPKQDQQIPAPTVDALIGEAHRAAAIRDWDRALVLLATASARDPARPDSFVEAAVIMWHAGSRKAADEALQAACRRFPTCADAAIQHANLATWEADWPEARRRWAEVKQRFPDHPAGHVEHAAVLLDMGRANEAESELEKTVRHFAFDSSATIYYAEAAARRGDWTEALRRVDAGIRRFPDDPRMQLARRRLAFIVASAEVPTAGASVMVADRQHVCAAEQFSVARSDFMLRFESVGSDCDFGLVQRRFGAEPLGLLRFAGGTFDGLIAALASRFEKLGDPASTRLVVWDRRREYWVVDEHYGFKWHTFRYEHATDPDLLLTQQCQRIRFLRDKLVSDLGAGEKIIVHHSRQPLTMVQIWRLYSALELFGPNVLLSLHPHHAGDGSSNVRVMTDRLFVANSPRVRVSCEWHWPGDIAQVPYEEWWNICDATDHLLAGRRCASKSTAS
jgi:tetratricopeptide (TPR) repeat protein